MRVFFTNVAYQSRVEHTSLISVIPPLDLATSAALVRRDLPGTEVALLDANVENLGEQEIARRAAQFAPDLMVVSAATHSINAASRLFSLTADFPCQRLLTGPHGSALPEQTLAAIPALDIIIRGEPEETILDTVNAVQNNRDLGEVSGLTFRRGTDLISTPDRGFNNSLDQLPMPAFDLLPMSRYSSPYSRRIAALRTTRGCPGRCTFCDSHLLFGCRTRLRSVEKVVDEIATCQATYKARYFAIIDHTFTASRKFVTAFSDEIIQRGLHKKIRWVCNTRVDMLDNDILDRMQTAGCLQIGIGIESADDKGLSQVKKGVTEDQIIAAIERIKKHNIICMGYAIIGFPEDTRESIARTRDKIFNFNPHTLQLSFATPLPGTGLWKQCQNEDRILSADWNDFVFLKKSIIRNKNMGTEELHRLRDSIVRDFYLRPGKLLELTDFFLRKARIDPFAAAIASGKILKNMLIT